MNLKKITICCLWLASVCSTIYLLMLGWFWQPSLDDYGYIANFENLGIWDTMLMAYNGWQGRFSTFLLAGIVDLIFGRASNLMPLTIILLLLGYTAISLILRDGLHLSNRNMRWCLSCLIINIGIMSYLEISTFYWLCALNYTLATWATLYLIYFIFLSRNCLVIRYLSGLLCAFYISGSAENYAPLVILCLGLLWIYKLYQAKEWRWWTMTDTHLLFWCLVILCFGFVVMLLAPGNAKRIESNGRDANLISAFQLFPFVLRTAKATIILALRYVSRIWYFILLFPIFIFTGRYIHQLGVKLPKVTTKSVLLLLLGFCVFFVISVAECVFGTGWYAAPRAFCFMSFVIMGVVFWLGVGFWNRLSTNNNVNAYCTIIASLLLCVASVSFIAMEYPKVKEYHNKVSIRNELIVSHAMSKSSDHLIVPSVYVQPFTNSYSYLRNFLNYIRKSSKRYAEPYFPYEQSILSADPRDWRNTSMNNWAGAEFDIISE